VCSPVGVGAAEYWSSLAAGKSGFAPLSAFEASGFGSQLAAEVKDLSSVTLPGRKDLWAVSRSITIGVAAAKLALEDAQIVVDENNRAGIGVVYGTTLACLKLLARFDQQSIREGPRYADPLMFPDTGVSAPACRVSIHLGMHAFNATLSNGQTSSLDAIRYGMNFIRMGRAHTVLAGGVEEFCFETYIGQYRRGALSGSRKAQPEMCRPFDRRRNGMVMGEGGAVLVLEDYEHALSRGARILAEVRGYGTSFDPAARGAFNPEAEGATAAMAMALDEAGLQPDDLDLILANANASRPGDRMEAKAVGRIFGTKPNAAVTAIKSMLGESYSAAGALQAAAAVLAMQHGLVPPTINHEEPDPECEVGSLVTRTCERKIATAMINSFGCAGTNASLVLAAA
jgi:3-oxoacyl-[acyl-carrier-protein] synthase II